MFWLALGTFIVILIAYAVKYGQNKNKYWVDRGIPHVKPQLFFGNYLDVILKRKTNGELVREILNDFPDEPLVGFYLLMKPVLIVNDLKLIERVLVKDFLHFVDHGVAQVDRESHPFNKNLFSETGKKWRAVRYQMSPMFTSGKLRSMTTGMIERSNIAVELIEAQAKSDYNKIDLTNTLIKMNLDMFGSCAFGLNTKHSQELPEFRKKAGRIITADWFTPLKSLIMLGLPKLATKLGLSPFRKDDIDYFAGLIRRSIEYREKENFTRNDFSQMLMALKQKGFVEMKVKDSTDDFLNLDSDAYLKESFDLTFDEILGHAFTFMISGIEPPAVAVIFLCHELALNPEVQEDVREEIRRCIEENEGIIDYQSVKNMTYLEQCVKESLRKYPLAEIIFRSCTKEYTFPGTGYTAKPGDTIHIPVLAVNYNPKLHQNPDKFIPERFSPDIKMPPCSYLTFSDGPRICIGMRLAIVQMKIAMCQLLLSYRFKPYSKTVRARLTPLIFSPWLRDKIYFNLEKLDPPTFKHQNKDY